MINDFTFRYFKYINNQLDGVCQGLWWFQDEAPAHRLKAVRYRFHEIFPNLVVALYHEVEQPLISPDMNSYDFFLWGYLKLKVFVTTPGDTQNLQNQI